MAAVGGGNSAQSDRLASGYAERMTAGGAWINISAADLSAQVAWASEGASWCEHACTTAVYNRRDLYDSLGGTMSDPIHAASDRVVSAQRDIADSTEALHKWWKFVEGQVEGTKYLIRNAVDLAMQEIETIENAPGVKAEDKKTAIDNLIETVHAENVSLVNAAAGMIGPVPQPYYTPPLHGDVDRTVQNTSVSNIPNDSTFGLNNERGTSGGSSGSHEGTSSERGRSDRAGEDPKEKGKNGDGSDHPGEGKEGKDKPIEQGRSGHSSDEQATPLERGSQDSPASVQPVPGQYQPAPSTNLPMSGGLPASGGGASGSGASGVGSLGSGLARPPASAAGLGTGGSGGPAPVSQAEFLRAFGTSTVDPGVVAPVAKSAMPVSSSPAPVQAATLPVVPVTAATGGPPAPLPPPAAVPPAAGPVVPPAVASPLPGGGLPFMGPPPAVANPLASAPPPVAPLSPAAAGPSVSVGAGGSAAAVVPMTASERARALVVRSTRQMLGDLAGEVRRLAAALTASSKRLPTLQWVVGGCPDDGSGPLLVVASSVGLGFIPADSRLPRHTAVHVFADSPNVAWGVKNGWLGNPVKAVLGYGVSIGRPVTVMAGRPEALTGGVPGGVGVEFVTLDNTPDSGVQGGRDRLEVVDPAMFDQISGLGMAALAALLPTAGGFETEPNNQRTMQLWTAADMAATVSEAHQIKAWQEFCADQAAASAYKVTRADSDLKARQYFSDFQYFVWNLAQLEKAAALAA